MNGEGMCQLSEINGKKQLNCGTMNNKSKKMLKVKSVPLSISDDPFMNDNIMKKSEKIINKQIEQIKKCYNGEFIDGKCVDPIELFVFKDERCSVCHKFIPEIKNRIKILKKNNIPIMVHEYDITKDNLEIQSLIEKTGCQGLPCIVMKDIHDSNNYRKITEGTDKMISFLSKIMQEPNPIIFKEKVNYNTAPRGLISYRKEMK